MLRATLAAYLPHGQVWNLAGPHNATRRQQLMQALTGEKLPKAKCGVTALEAAIYARCPWITGTCAARRADVLIAWIRRGEA